VHGFTIQQQWPCRILSSPKQQLRSLAAGEGGAGLAAAGKAEQKQQLVAVSVEARRATAAAAVASALQSTVSAETTAADVRAGWRGSQHAA
jgi:hypothetical protein